MRGSNLTLAIALVGLGAVLIWVGYADPPGGLVGVITDKLSGKKVPAKTTQTVDVGTVAAALAGAAPTVPAAGVATGNAVVPNSGAVSNA
jgi:hypothetical protein